MCDLHVQEPMYDTCRAYLEYAASPPEVQHKIPGEIQVLPYFYSAYIFKGYGYLVECKNV